MVSMELYMTRAGAGGGREREKEKESSMSLSPLAFLRHSQSLSLSSGKSLPSSVPQNFHLQNGNMNPHQPALLWGQNKSGMG